METGLGGWTDQVVVEEVHLLTACTSSIRLDEDTVSVHHVAIDDPHSILPAGQIRDPVEGDVAGIFGVIGVAFNHLAIGRLEGLTLQDELVVLDFLE